MYINHIVCGFLNAMLTVQVFVPVLVLIRWKLNEQCILVYLMCLRCFLVFIVRVPSTHIPIPKAGLSIQLPGTFREKSKSHCLGKGTSSGICLGSLWCILDVSLGRYFGHVQWVEKPRADQGLDEPETQTGISWRKWIECLKYTQTVLFHWDFPQIETMKPSLHEQLRQVKERENFYNSNVMVILKCINTKECDC